MPSKSRGWRECETFSFCPLTIEGLVNCTEDAYATTGTPMDLFYESSVPKYLSSIVYDPISNQVWASAVGTSAGALDEWQVLNFDGGLPGLGDLHAARQLQNGEVD